MIRQAVLFILSLGMTGVASGQISGLKKSVIQQTEVVEISSSKVDIQRLLKVQQRIKQDGRNLGAKSTPGGSRTGLKKDEYLIYMNENVAFKTRELGNGVKEFVKEIRGSVTNRLEIGSENLVSVLDAEGYFIVCDYLDGVASEQRFYSPEFILLKSYRPYYTFQTTAGISGSFVCIYSKEKIESTVYKLAILNRQGDVITEREFRSQSFVSNVDVIENRVFLVLTSLTGPQTRLLCFDEGLRILWSKDLTSRVVEDRLSFSTRSSLVYSTLKEVTCLEVASGRELWRLNPEQFGEGNFIESEFVFGDEYVAITSSFYEAEVFRRNTLALVNSKNGSNAMIEQLGQTRNRVEVIPRLGGFVLIADSQYIIYSK